MLICLSALTAEAQDRGTFYAGGSVSLYDSTIIEQITQYRAGILTGKHTVESEYNGQAYGFYFGYRLVDKKRVFINIQAHGYFLGKEFNVTTTDNILRRKLFCSRGIDLQPGYNITDKLSCFFNFSVERGRFQLSETEITKIYDIDIPVMGYGFGMGIGTHVFPSVAVRLQYQFNQYGKTEISTAFGTEVIKMDVNELLPRYDYIMLSVQYNFGK